MSELTPCCFCALRDIRRRAEHSGRIVEVVSAPEEIPGWTKSVNVYVRRPDEVLDTDKHFAAWLGEVTERCCC